MQSAALVFVPTGSAAADFYGGNRRGDNLYANCLLALDAATGKLRWHFQFVKHDVLDRDLPTAPTLVTLRVKGKSVDALVQTTKQGFVFVLNRDTGKPVFPVEEVPAPPSDVPGEVANPTYLRPKLPAPYARQRLTADDLTHAHAGGGRRAREQFAKTCAATVRSSRSAVGIDTTIYPGFDGGAEWGGPAWDPDTGLLYVNSNEMAWLGSLAFNDTGRSTGKSIYLRDCAACHGDNLQGSPPQFPSLVGLAKRMTPADFTALRTQGRRPHARVRRPAGRGDQRHRKVSVRRRGHSRGRARSVAASTRSTASRVIAAGSTRKVIPRWRMPWGTLNAIELATGKYAWSIPFGEFPELAARGIKDTGSENYGGPLVTSGGLLFIGATIHDRKFRAFDKRNGKLLWEAALPCSADATPITYQVDGRQYVAIFASGGKERGGSGGGVYLSYALPPAQ